MHFPSEFNVFSLHETNCVIAKRPGMIPSEDIPEYLEKYILLSLCLVSSINTGMGIILVMQNCMDEKAVDAAKLIQQFEC